MSTAASGRRHSHKPPKEPPLFELPPRRNYSVIEVKSRPRPSGGMSSHQQPQSLTLPPPPAPKTSTGAGQAKSSSEDLMSFCGATAKPKNEFLEQLDKLYEQPPVVASAEVQMIQKARSTPPFQPTFLSPQRTPALQVSEKNR